MGSDGELSDITFNVTDTFGKTVIERRETIQTNFYSRGVSRRSFLKASAALAGMAPVTGLLSRTQSVPLVAYVGTFSSPLRDTLPTQVDLPPGNGRGIHLFRRRSRVGALKPSGIVEMGTSPSCLALQRRAERASIPRTRRIAPATTSRARSAHSRQPDGRQLELLNTVRSGGAGPTYVSVHPGGRHLLVANYFGGSVAVLPILADGRLGEPRMSRSMLAGSGHASDSRATWQLRREWARSDSRAHDSVRSVGPIRAPCRPGLDKIFVWRFDDQRGVLTANDPPSMSLPPGDGPRHFDFHPNGRWLYSIQEEGSTVVLFDYDAAAGRLTERQTISTLPPGFAGSNFCSEILVSADGHFVYAGNRLHDSIAIFSVEFGRPSDVRQRGMDARRTIPGVSPSIRAAGSCTAAISARMRSLSSA